MRKIISIISLLLALVIQTAFAQNSCDDSINKLIRNYQNKKFEFLSTINFEKKLEEILQDKKISFENKSIYSCQSRDLSLCLLLGQDPDKQTVLENMQYEDSFIRFTGIYSNKSNRSNSPYVNVMTKDDSYYVPGNPWTGGGSGSISVIYKIFLSKNIDQFKAINGNSISEGNCKFVNSHELRKNALEALKLYTFDQITGNLHDPKYDSNENINLKPRMNFFIDENKNIFQILGSNRENISLDLLNLMNSEINSVKVENLARYKPINGENVIINLVNLDNRNQLSLEEIAGKNSKNWSCIQPKFPIKYDRKISYNGFTRILLKNISSKPTTLNLKNLGYQSIIRAELLSLGWSGDLEEIFPKNSNILAIDVRAKDIFDPVFINDGKAVARIRSYSMTTMDSKFGIPFNTILFGNTLCFDLNSSN